MQTDPISDMLTRVRNAVGAHHLKVDVPASRTKVSIVDLLKNHGFIKNYKLFKKDEKGVLRIYLKYAGRKPVIHGLQRVSRPSLRVYRSHKELPEVRNGIGMAIISTPKGILGDKVARENKVGGEVLCKIW